jgi:hypothetical protein
MGLPDEYSTVCEDCGCFGWEPLRCKDCWMKAVKKAIDECDPEPCCHAINKKELLKKLERIE